MLKFEKKGIHQAVILAGGRGSRLKPLTDELPKPLAPIHGIPFLDYLIDSLIQIGIRRFLLLVGYRYEMIVQRYQNGVKNNVEISFSIGGVEDQTGTRLCHAYPLLDDHFLLLYGDNYWPLKFDEMLDLYQQKKVKALTTVFNNQHGTGEYGKENNIAVDENNFIVLYDPQRRSNSLNGVDIGYFIMDKHILDMNMKSNFSLEKDILPKLILEKQLIAYRTDIQYYTITDISSVRNFERYVMANHVRPSLEKRLK